MSAVMCFIYKCDRDLWLLSIVVYNMSGIFSTNSNVLDKKKHFRIILCLETKGKKIKSLKITQH